MQMPDMSVRGLVHVQTKNVTQSRESEPQISQTSTGQPEMISANTKGLLPNPANVEKTKKSGKNPTRGFN